MLEYQKSSPAHSLDENTTADKRVFLKPLAQVRCVNVAFVRAKIFSIAKSCACGAAANDFWYSSMRRPPCLTHMAEAGEKPPQTPTP